MSKVDISNLGYGGQKLNDALRKAVAELQGLKLNLVAGAGAGTQIAITDMELEDTLVAVLNMTDLADLDVADFSIGDRRAFGTLTLDEALEDGDTFVLNDKTYTFVEVNETIAYNAPPRTIPIAVGPSSTDNTVVAERMAKVIMSSDSEIYAEADVDASGVAIVRVIWRVPGTVGNAVDISVAGSGGHLSASSYTTLHGGSATNGIVGTSSTSGKTLLVVWLDKNAE